MRNMLEIGWTGSGDAPYSRAELYDAAAYGADRLALHWLLEHFDIVSRPRERIGSPLRRGDILLRRGEAGLAHACVVLDPQFRSGLEVSLQGGTAEIGGRGNFVFVAERGARPHEEHERFARRVTDDSGRVLGKQIVLRPREGAGEAERIDPMSIMVGMTLAQQMTARPPATQVTVVNPNPEKGADEWAPPNFGSEAEPAARSGAQPEPMRVAWPTMKMRPAHRTGLAGEAVEGELASAAEFNSPEHFQLGNALQTMVDNWAKHGLVSGGCFVVDADANGHVKSFSQWQFFVPDRSTPVQPYGDGRLPSDAHWHWITPNPHSDEHGHLWTSASLATALREGRALTMSVGDLVMMSGDLVGEFRDYTDAATSGWRDTRVNFARGLAANEPFAYSIIRALQFPREGLDAPQDIRMLARAGTDPTGSRNEIRSVDPTWTMVQQLIDFIRRAAGSRGYHQLLLLSRILRRKDITIRNIERLAPWITSADHATLLRGPASAHTGFTLDTTIDDEVFQIVLTNGYYAELALHNERHFNPNNWRAFEDAHTAALNMIDRQVSLPAGGVEHGPIPANAIAQLAYGMHFQTDAFAAGHMRTPRTEMGPDGSMLAGVMHDFENQFGVIVQNGFNERWRAFGDSNLNAGSPAQNALLRRQYATSAGVTPRLDPRATANREHAIAAVLAAMKQLHYQAQRHFNDTALNPQFHEILRIVRGVSMQLLYDEVVLGSTPGEHSGDRDSWIAMDIAAKIAYMRRHKPVPIPWSTHWEAGTANHPPMAESNSAHAVVLDHSRSYTYNQHLLSDRVLYDVTLNNADDFRKDITQMVLLAYLAPAAAKAWAGASERWLQDAMRTSWGDDRNSLDSTQRRIFGIYHIGLP